MERIYKDCADVIPRGEIIQYFHLEGGERLASLSAVSRRELVDQARSSRDQELSLKDQERSKEKGEYKEKILALTAERDNAGTVISQFQTAVDDLQKEKAALRQQAEAVAADRAAIEQRAEAEKAALRQQAEVAAAEKAAIQQNMLKVCDFVKITYLKHEWSQLLFLKQKIKPFLKVF